MVIKVSAIDRQNSTDLASIEIEPRCGEEVELYADIQLGTIELSLDGTLYLIGLLSAMLSLDLEGMRIKVGSKAGMINSLSKSVGQETRQTKQHKQSTTLTSMLSGTTPSFGASTEISADRDSADVTTMTSEYRHTGIRSTTGNRWRIEDANKKGKIIESSILNGARLCALAADHRANRMTCRALLYSAPAEIEVRKKRGARRPSNLNRQRILGLVATKSLSANSRYAEGTTSGILLCSTDMEYEYEQST